MCISLLCVYICVCVYVCKVKWSRYRPVVGQKVDRGIALLFHDRGTRTWWVVRPTPRPHFTPGKDAVPIVKLAGWAPGPVWTGAEYLAPTGIRSRNIQPVVSSYTDWATRPTYLYYSSMYILLFTNDEDIRLLCIMYTLKMVKSYGQNT